MTDTTLLLYLILLLAAQCLLLAWIISASTQTRKRVKYQEIEMRLLRLIAQKLGATGDEVNATLYNTKIR